MALTNAERQARFKAKRNANPARRAAYLQYEKTRYKADVSTGKKKLIKDMTPRAQRKQRKEWREKYHSSQTRKKESASASSQASVPASSCSSISRQKATALQRKAEERDHLKDQITALERQLSEAKKRVKTLEKRAERQAKKPPNTPRSKTKALLKSEDLNVPKSSNVRKTLEFHYALVKEIATHPETADGSKGRFLSTMAAGNVLRKYRLLSRVHKELGVRGRRKRSYRKRGSVSVRVAKIVRDFYLKENVSKVCPGKKDTVTRYKVKKQRRVLTDTVSILYRQYISEEAVFVSFTTFWRLKPFWVLPPKNSDRQTCLCKICQNCKLLATSLYREGYLSTKKLDELMTTVACNVPDCNHCERKPQQQEGLTSTKTLEGQVKYYQWGTTKEDRVFRDGKEKMVSFVEKQQHTDSVSIVWNLFEGQLRAYIHHITTVRAQYAHYRNVRDNLSESEGIIHVDFSENYECKWESAIQSAHYGASKKQISLHTGYCKVGKNKIRSFCGVSNSLDHDPFAIWAHLGPVLDRLKTKDPDVTRLHFFSDGPTAQYRQKINFYLLSNIVQDKGFAQCTWNFFGAGHGKGIPDGIGGTVKRAADARVKFGADICNAAQFAKHVSKACPAIDVYTVNQNDINSVKKTYMVADLKSVPGTMKLHQVCSSKRSCIDFRNVSCTCCKQNECNATHTLKHHTFLKGKAKNSSKCDCEETPRSKCENVGRNSGCEGDGAIGCEDVDVITVKKSGEADEKLYESSGECDDVDDCTAECDSIETCDRIDTECESIGECSSVKHSTQYLYGADTFKNYLRRLRMTKSFDELIHECQSQMSEMEEIQGKDRSVIGSRMTIDGRALPTVPSDIPCKSHQPFPVCVRCDGDCLPACGAVFAFGQDVRPDEMRLRIVHELAVNAAHYLNDSHLCMGGSANKKCVQLFASFSDHYLPGVHDLGKITVIRNLYEKEIRDICKPGSYMGIWQMFGLASVLKMRVCSVYPNISACNGIRTQLHRVIEPRQRATDDIAKILWTSTRASTMSFSWVPNHFVPLLAFNQRKD